MPVAPLFNLDRSSLKAALRLSAAAQTDAEAQIDLALQQARIRFYDSLGADRISTLLGASLLEAPTTTQGLLRLRASTTEIAMVRQQLLRIMPVLLQDGAAGLQQSWNEEGLTRGATTSEVARQISRLEDEIVQSLEALKGDSEAPEGIAAACIGPTTRTPYPDSFIYSSGEC